MGFPRQEYWSGLPFPSPGELPGPGIEPGSPALQADSLPSEPPVVIKQILLSSKIPAAFLMEIVNCSQNSYENAMNSE